MINIMEQPAQSLDLYPLENLGGDIKNAASETKPRNAAELWNIVLWSWTGIPAHRCWTCSTPFNTDVKQFSVTVVIQLNLSSVIRKKAKSSNIFQFML